MKMRACVAAICGSLVLMSLPVSGGTFGEVVSGSTTGVAGVLTDIATANIGYLDNNPADGNLGPNEALVLGFHAAGVLQLGDIILSNPAGSGLTGAVGSAITNPPGGAFVIAAGGLRFVDTLPTYAQGGPDGKFNPGEPLFLDADSSGGANAGDRLLVSGVGLAGAAGAALTGSQVDTVWDSGSECMFSSADAAVDAADVHISVNTAGCPAAVGTALGAIGSVFATDNTVTVTDGVTTAASTTVTSATGPFVAPFAVGYTISGGSIPAGATITAINSANSVTISAPATTSATGVSVKVGSANAYEPGEHAYIGGGTTVTNGLYRVTDSNGVGSAGTTVSCGIFGADADCANPLAAAALVNTKATLASRAYALPATPFAYFDANGNGAFDINDKLLLDVDSDNMISPADVRFNSAGQTFGARPKISDGDTQARAGIALPALRIIWLDGTNNVGQVDPTEPLALDLDGGVAPFYLGNGDICLTAVGSCTAGSQRIGTHTPPATGGTWKDVSTATNPGNLGYQDTNNNNIYDRGDTMILHFGALPANSATGDLVIASDTGATGTRLAGAPVALKALPVAPAAAVFALRALDVDGSGGYSIGDLVYYDRSTAGPAEPGDVRFNSGTGVTGFGRNIAATDADAVPTLLNPAPAANPFAFRDIDSTPGFSVQDPLYLLPRATSCPLVGSDVTLSPGTSGETAGASFTGTKNNCATIPAGAKFGFTPVGAYNKDAKLYLDLGADGIVSTGDVRISASTFGAAGARVFGASANDLNQQITLITVGVKLNAAFAGGVAFGVHDLNGDAIGAGAEPVVLDVNGDGLLTPGDVFLSGGGGSTGGGGGGAPTTQPPATTTTTTTASTTGTSTVTATTTTTTTAAGASLAALNTALASSLKVENKDNGNHLTFEAPPAGTGVQVGRARSPYTLIATLDDASAGAYHDPDGQKGDRYIVTAFTGSDGRYTTYEGIDIPGLGAEPAGQSASDSREPVPAPGVLMLLAAIAAALVVARRRL